jgi:hypothetical protein
LRVHNPADVCGTGLVEQLDGPSDIAIGQLAVSVDPDDDLVLGCSNAEVQGRRRTRTGIVDHTDPRVDRCKRVGDLARSVAAGPDRKDHLELTGIVLIKHPTNCRLEVAFLVEHWHDDRDPGPGYADSIPNGGHSIILPVPVLERLAQCLLLAPFARIAL